MELSKIEELLSKYLEAETTLQEEEMLRNYFLNDDIPNHLEKYKGLFNYFSDSKLENSTKSIKLKRKSYSIQWLSIAAMFVLMVSIFTIYERNSREQEQARLAFQETQKALNLISSNLNKGNNAVAQLKVFENTQNRIFKNE